jgi:acyl-CoA synthetase (AMP-forming)/AMP-acid ligase II
MYSAGKDGDLRDIWRRVTGEIPLEKGSDSSKAGKILTVMGKEEIVDHKIEDITAEIKVIGKYLSDRGAKRVAVYLPNSLEFLAAVFAGAFYGFTPILIPYNQPHTTLIELLIQTGADSLIAQAGSLPLDDVSKGVSGLRQVIWTVEKTSRHMDWNEVPEGIGGNLDVSVWHQLVQDQKSADSKLPSDTAKAPGVVFLWQQGVRKSAEVVEFSQNVRDCPLSIVHMLTTHRISRLLSAH